MPFTFAHPAIVMPLLQPRLRRWFSATGLVVGSMAPDFESFIRMGRYKYFSHHWSGIIWFDLPLAILITLVFHYIVRDPLIDNMPDFLRSRCWRWYKFDFTGYMRRHYLALLVSLVVGICSHLLWDAVTHLNMSRPDSIRSMLMFGRFRVYILMQYAFSVIGLIVMALYVRKLPQTDVINKKEGRFKFWLYILLIATALEIYRTTSVEAIRVNWLFVINVTIGSLMFALTIVSLADQFIAPKLKRY